MNWPKHSLLVHYMDSHVPYPQLKHDPGILSVDGNEGSHNKLTCAKEF